jgi:hypothetical protein
MQSALKPVYLLMHYCWSEIESPPLAVRLCCLGYLHPKHADYSLAVRSVAALPNVAAVLSAILRPPLSWRWPSAVAPAARLLVVVCAYSQRGTEWRPALQIVCDATGDDTD